MSMPSENAHVESPCVGICVVDKDDICEGCGRSMDEIAGWLRMSNTERAAAVEKSRRRLADRQA